MIIKNSKLKTKINKILLQMKLMPLFLRFITTLCLGGILFIIGPLCPIGNFTINDQPVTFIEFWNTGAGPIMLILGILLFTSGIGILKYKKWGRNLFIFSYIFAFISSMLIFKSIGNFYSALASLFFLIFVYAYLFLNRKVSACFK